MDIVKQKQNNINQITIIILIHIKLGNLTQIQNKYTIITH